MAFPEAPSLDAAGNSTASAETSEDRAPVQDRETSTPERTDAELRGNEREVEQAVQDLEKLGKFKFAGQEWTAKDLEKAILRQKDYTQKTQKFAEERKAFEQSSKDELKFYKNLSFDIQNVLKDPSLAAEFIRVYPEKFHAELREALNMYDANKQAAQGQGQPQQQMQQQNTARPDIELMSRLQKLETFYHQQEVAKNTAEVNSQIASMTAKYPKGIPQIALGTIFENYSQTGEKPTVEQWDQAFKDSAALREQLTKEDYAEKVSQQKQANAKGRTDDAGGGMVGKAPAKARSLKEAQEMMLRDLTRNGI